MSKAKLLWKRHWEEDGQRESLVVYEEPPKSTYKWEKKNSSLKRNCLHYQRKLYTPWQWNDYQLVKGKNEGETSNFMTAFNDIPFPHLQPLTPLWIAQDHTKL